MEKMAAYEELASSIKALTLQIEEEKQTRKKLEYLLLRYKGIFNHTVNGVAVLRAEEGGRNFRFIDFNRAAEVIDQINREKVTQRLLIDVFPQMQAFGLVERLRNVFKTGKPERIKSGYYKDQRIQGWREYYIYKLSAEELVIVYRDITNIMNAKAALHQSQAKYQALYHFLKRMADNVPDAIWAKDLKDRFLFVNQAMCEKILHCKDMQEALGKEERFFAQRQRDWGYRNTFGDACADSDATVKNSKKPGRFLEDGLVRGAYIALDVSKAPFFDKEGTLIGTVGSGRDITKEKEMESALKESEDRFTIFMGHFPGVVFLCNEKLDLIYVNPHMRKVIGEAAAIGRSLNHLFKKSDSQNHSLGCLEALTKGMQESNESLVDYNGDTRIYRVMKFPIYRPGKSTILGGIGLDITSLIAAQAVLRSVCKNGANE